MPEKEIDFRFNSSGYIAFVDEDGRRLLELMIKDGEFLVTDGLI